LFQSRPRAAPTITTPGQLLGTIFESPLQPPGPFIELTDQDEQLIGCGIDVLAEGEDIAIEILDRARSAVGFMALPCGEKVPVILPEIW